MTWHWVRFALWAAFAVCAISTGVDPRCLIVAFAATAVTLGLAATDRNWRK
ncbi:MAG TPA: hypothetical protein VFJ82_02475 [Longimicrobium sp.]|nr:hypothetical protein [Longimicrobium sp.]